MFAKAILLAKLFGHISSLLLSYVCRSLSVQLSHLAYRLKLFSPPPSSAQEPLNIIIIGASFAGLFAARSIAQSLPPKSPYKVVVVEPHSHFHFTWVLPRFCVIRGQEHKAFIPYTHKFFGGNVRWIRDRVASVGRDKIRLQSDGREIPYWMLLIATGSGGPVDAENALPSRVGVDGRTEGLERLRAIQRRIEKAGRLVVVGGGAAGVELATDAKTAYPEKIVTLVHSREAVMHRFGPGLRNAALKGLTDLGVNVLVGERVVEEDAEAGFILLKSGMKIDCDYLVNCAGQRPSSGLLEELSPSSISETGHIRVKPTLQILDDMLPNIFACGDVADTGNANPNARAAFKQADIVVNNVLDVVNGKTPQRTYYPHWADGLIKLTLGLNQSISHVGDGKTELLFKAKDKEVDLGAAKAWKLLRAKPFEGEKVAAFGIDLDEAP